jgi:hypothetical protein
MFKFLFFIFFFVILLTLLMGFSVLRTIKNVLFGSSPRKNTRQQQRQTTQKKTTTRKKIFDKGEGEYIDYEEVKN